MATQPTPASELDHRLRGFAAGWHFAGRYRMENLIGRGGMGVVWRAMDETLERPVALKFLVETLVHDPMAIDDLKRETRRALELTHHNIVRVYDFVEDPIEGLAGIAMEFFPGQTLTARRIAETSRCFAPDTVTPWLAQLCDALVYAHEKVGVIHRDLKPQNLMLDDRGELKITDFGIARVATDSLTRISIGEVSGTPSYMSPQQARGESAKVSDDVYAIGTTIYELLTSRPPFWQGDIATQILTAVPPKISERLRELTGVEREIPDIWEETIGACLEKDPANRPASAREIADRLGIPLPSTYFHFTPGVHSGPDAAPSVTPAVDLAALQPDLELEFPTLIGAPIPHVPQTPSLENVSRIPPPLPAVRPRQESPIPRSLLFVGAAVVLGVLALTGGAVVRHLITSPDSAETIPAVPAEPSPPATSNALVVPGSFPTIQAAIDGAQDIKTISLRPGVYRESVTLKDGIRLVGEDAAKCRIIPLDGATFVLLARGVRGCVIENLSVDGSGAADRNARTDGIAISDAEVKVIGCTVRGMTGTGVMIHGTDTAAEINGNLIEGNGLHGIMLLRTGSLTALHKNEVRQNRGAGIHFNDGADGTAEENLCEKNGESGIVADGVSTAPTLQSNRCVRNEKYGILFMKAARGSATGNTCEGNGDSGLAGIGEGTAPDFVKNTTQGNTRFGILFMNGADGDATGNICQENQISGIAALGTSTRPVLSQNQLVRNQKFGIESTNGASPRIAPDNVFTGNVSGEVSR